MTVTRRTFLAAAGGVAATLTAGGARAQLQFPVRNITLVESYGPDSLTAQLAGLLEPGLERELGVPVGLTSMPHAQLRQTMQNAPGDGSVLALTVPLDDAVDRAMAPPGQKLPPLTPVAKLTKGISEALFTRMGSPFVAFDDLRTVDRRRTLRVGMIEVESAQQVLLAMLRRTLSPTIVPVGYPGFEALIKAVQAGEVDLGVARSNALIPSAKVRPPPVSLLATFGAARNPARPGVPTFAELTGQRTNAFTVSAAVFGPPGLDSRSARRVVQALEAAASVRSVVDAARDLNIPLAIAGSDLLSQSMAREARVIDRVKPLGQ